MVAVHALCLISACSTAAIGSWYFLATDGHLYIIPGPEWVRPLPIAHRFCKCFLCAACGMRLSLAMPLVFGSNSQGSSIRTRWHRQSWSPYDVIEEALLAYGDPSSPVRVRYAQ